jgi:hypothetical protein
VIVSTRVPGDTVAEVGSRLYLLWAGLSVGVAFLATPAKFLAPSLSLTTALQVGQKTFRVYGGAELGLVGVIALLGLWSAGRGRWFAALLPMAAIVLIQRFGLLPPLDLEVAEIQAGGTAGSSYFHLAYIALEAIKLICALTLGFGAIRLRPALRRTSFSFGPQSLESLR